VQDHATAHNTNSWETNVDDLADFAEWITERARLALDDSEVVCTPTETACKWCTHAPKCKALFEFTSSALDFEDLDTEELIIGNSEVAEIADILDLMGKRNLIDIALKAYETRIFDEIKDGNEVEGYKVIQTSKRKTWVNEIEAYDKVKSWLPLDDVAPRKLATPTQVGKMLGGAISSRKKNIFDELWDTPEGDMKLVKSSQRGEPISFKKFEDLEEEDY